MSQRILIERQGHVLTITNNDPKTLNSLSADVFTEFLSAINTAATDDTARAIVLTGGGGFFCSGGNVQDLKAHAAASFATRHESIGKLNAIVEAMRACPRPIIAAVEGGAAGAGVALALAADMIVAARDAYMAIAYVKVGLTPDGGTTALLSRIIPRQMLSEMAMTGERISVQRMHDLGVVNALCASGEALSKVQQLAARIAGGPPAAIAKSKDLIRQAETNSFKAQLDAEAESIAVALGGPEAREGIAAFLEKRRPNW